MQVTMHRQVFILCHLLGHLGTLPGPALERASSLGAGGWLGEGKDTEAREPGAATGPGQGRPRDLATAGS